jgi:hypothetical protein
MKCIGMQSTLSPKGGEGWNLRRGSGLDPETEEGLESARGFLQ